MLHLRNLCETMIRYMIRYLEKFKTVSSNRLLVYVSVFFILFCNNSFFSNVLTIYPLNANNLFFIVSLAIVFTAALVLLLSVFCFKYTIKPILITLLLVSSLAAYFMDSYNTIIDENMVQNIINTDFHESLDLFSFKLVLYLFFYGILPSIYVYKVHVNYLSFWKEVIARVKLIAGMLLTMVISIALLSDFYSSFFREHKPLRYYSNPGYYIFSTTKYVSSFFKSATMKFKEIAEDAKKLGSNDNRKLVIFVVGETARADRFSLNGYKRETNPGLEKENVVSFSNFWSCGTTTSVSVPCMFSSVGEKDYDKEVILHTENVLDILQRVGDNILWLDNNSSSKGVADRVPYQSYKSPDVNPVCDSECRDVGMLANLQEYIDKTRKGDIFIVLHQMGNHGPAYYKRYPEAFKKFKPVCKTNQLEDCSSEEINNAYDNAIRYTDYFLVKTIDFLKKNSEFQSAMLYVSDHGESLGENRLYLHGLPNFIAPDVQLHVPVIFWASKNNRQFNLEQLLQQKNRKLSHDNLFSTILGMMDVKTKVYQPSMDFLRSEGTK